jgi:hypothetical protein
MSYLILFELYNSNEGECKKEKDAHTSRFALIRIATSAGRERVRKEARESNGCCCSWYKIYLKSIRMQGRETQKLLTIALN